MEKFKKLGLDNTTLNVLESLGYESPTEIQEKTIPVLLKSDGDFVGLAQTGTGKTAAFLLPLGEKTRLKFQANTNIDTISNKRASKSDIPRISKAFS